jgi:LmbE family N-acetylglucosaminyl deacetylase
MRNHQISKWNIALLLGSLIVAALPAVTVHAQAQQSRTLSIRDGGVFLNGERIAQDELPPSLDTEGIQAHYTFSGDVRPVIEINGMFFVVEEDGLRTAEAGEQDGVSMFLREYGPFRENAANGFQFKIQDYVSDISDFAAPHAAAIETQARQLSAQAAEFTELQSRLQEQFGDRRMQELTEAAQRLGLQAQRAAMAAESLPRIEVQHYLEGIQREDRELYELLLREREMEQESIRLSQEIRVMSDSADRVERTGELRETLDEIFELKQDNRRREIKQFESRLAELQERLVERERRREQIIDGRLRQLLDLQDDTNW